MSSIWSSGLSTASRGLSSVSRGIKSRADYYGLTNLNEKGRIISTIHEMTDNNFQLIQNKINEIVVSPSINLSKIDLQDIGSTNNGAQSTPNHGSPSAGSEFETGSAGPETGSETGSAGSAGPETGSETGSAGSESETVSPSAGPVPVHVPESDSNIGNIVVAANKYNSHSIHVDENGADNKIGGKSKRRLRRSGTNKKRKNRKTNKKRKYRR
jgi:hypothetical protein